MRKIGVHLNIATVLAFSCQVYGLFKCKKVFFANGYLARFLQNERSSYKILAERMAILQDSCKKWLSCKILQDSGRNSCKTMYRLARFCQILAKSCKITIRIRLGSWQTLFPLTWAFFRKKNLWKRFSDTSVRFSSIKILITEINWITSCRITII